VRAAADRLAAVTGASTASEEQFGAFVSVSTGSDCGGLCAVEHAVTDRKRPARKRITKQ